ncbi:DUF6232 family protein [Frankia alni]|nr:DUF6232 family protein [Frankia alni]
MSQGTGITVQGGLLYIGRDVYNLSTITRVSRIERRIGFQGGLGAALLAKWRWYLPLAVGAFVNLPFLGAGELTFPASIILVLASVLLVVGVPAALAGVVQAFMAGGRGYILHSIVLESAGVPVEVVVGRDPAAISHLADLIAKAVENPRASQVNTYYNNITTSIGRIEHLDNRGGRLGSTISHQHRDHQ